jgi:hypothetical protein
VYRKFKLLNEVGEELNLSEVHVLFLEEVSGLGESVDIEVKNISNFLKITAESTQQKEIEGTLKFGSKVSDSYQQYMRFSSFVKHARTLTLAYTLPLPELSGVDRSPVYANCRVIEQEKSEANEFSRLEEKVRFLLLEPWHSKVIKKVVQQQSTGGNKYDLEQEYDLDVEYTGYSFTESTFFNFSTTPVPIEFFIDGVADKPEIMLRNTKTGEIEVRWQYIDLVKLDDKIHHNSHPENRFVKLNSVYNVYPKVNKNVGYSSLIMIPPGTYKIEYACSNEGFGDLVIYFQNYWSVI